LPGYILFFLFRLLGLAKSPEPLLRLESTKTFVEPSAGFLSGIFFFLFLFPLLAAVKESLSKEFYLRKMGIIRQNGSHTLISGQKRHKDAAAYGAAGNEWHCQRAFGEFLRRPRRQCA
jgi:hypothetical protein